MNTRHKHCKQCGLDFTPPDGQAWMEYCSIKCVEDYQKTQPIPVPSNVPNSSPQWFITGSPAYICGYCGKQLVPNQPHQHSFFATTGSSFWNGQ